MLTTRVLNRNFLPQSTSAFKKPVTSQTRYNLNDYRQALSQISGSSSEGKVAVNPLPYEQWPHDIQKAIAPVYGSVHPSVLTEESKRKLAGIVEEKADCALFCAAGMILSSNLLNYKELGRQISTACDLHLKKNLPGTPFDYDAVLAHCKKAITAEKVNTFMTLFKMPRTEENQRISTSFLATLLADHILKTHLGIKGGPANEAFIQSKIKEEALELSEHMGDANQLKHYSDKLLQSMHNASSGTPVDLTLISDFTDRLLSHRNSQAQPIGRSGQGLTKAELLDIHIHKTAWPDLPSFYKLPASRKSTNG